MKNLDQIFPPRNSMHRQQKHQTQGLGLGLGKIVLIKEFSNIPLEHTQTFNHLFMVRNSFHLRVKGDAWGMRNRGYVGVLLDLRSVSCPRAFCQSSPACRCVAAPTGRVQSGGHKMGKGHQTFNRESLYWVLRGSGYLVTGYM